MRVNMTLTITAGVPLNVSTQSTVSDGVPRMATRVFIQLYPGATGIAYIMDGISGVSNGAPRVPSHSNSTDLTAIVYGATASAPGSSYSDYDAYHGIDVSKLWIDGSVSGDKVIVSFDLKV